MRILLIAVILTSISTTAATSYRVNNGQTVDITEHGQCRRVTNSSGSDKFIPTATATEWANFYNNGTPGVTIAACGCAVTPGWQSFTTAGTHSFTVPCHNNLTVQVWGGGGGGASGVNNTQADGTAGGQSKWNNAVFANGGAGAIDRNGGAGGTASGGTTNTSGSAGGYGGSGSGTTSGSGGASPNGGATRAGVAYANLTPVPGLVGNAPGGGATGAHYFTAGGGGGGGGYSTRTYTSGVFSVGSSVSLTVGAGGAGGSLGGNNVGGTGAVGRVVVSWD